MLGVSKSREEMHAAGLRGALARGAGDASYSVQSIRQTVQTVLEAMRSKGGVGAMRGAPKVVQVLLSTLEDQTKEIGEWCVEFDQDGGERASVPPCLWALMDAEFGRTAPSSSSSPELVGYSFPVSVMDTAWLRACVKDSQTGAFIDKRRCRAPHECPISAKTTRNKLVVALCTPSGGGAATLCVYLEGVFVAFLQLGIEERGGFVVPRQIAIVTVEESVLPGADAWSLSEEPSLAEMTEALRNVARYYVALARIDPRLRPWVMPLTIRWIVASGTLDQDLCAECGNHIVKSINSSARILPILREWRAAPLARAIQEGRAVPAYHPACVYWPVMP